MKGISLILVMMLSMIIFNPVLDAKQTSKAKKHKKDKKKKPPLKIPYLYWYTWTKGEDIKNVAKLFSVTPAQIKSWNKDQKYPYKSGDKLIIYAPQKVYKNIKEKYITVKKISIIDLAKDLKILEASIKKWNPKLKDPVAKGTSITYYKKIGYDESKPEGKPEDGHLVNGVQLPDKPEWYLRLTPEQEYGTESTIRQIVAAFTRFRHDVPDAPVIVIGHISKKEGGPISPHQSHQSGLDADIGYVPKGKALTAFVEMNENNMDLEKTYRFVDAFLKGGRVQYIFMSMANQKLLYEYAKDKLKVSASYLDSIFQYPGEDGTGIIRTSPGHGNHFHVRFLP